MSSPSTSAESNNSIKEIRRRVEKFELEGEIETIQSVMLPLPPGHSKSPYSDQSVKSTHGSSDDFLDDFSNERSASPELLGVRKGQAIQTRDDAGSPIAEFHDIPIAKSDASDDDWDIVDAKEIGDDDDDWVLIPDDIIDEVTQLRKQIPSVVIANTSFKVALKEYLEKCTIPEKVETVKTAVQILAYLAKEGAQAATEPVYDWANQIVMENTDLTIPQFSSRVYCTFVSTFLPERTHNVLL
ncbi:hypothetical protein EJ08DRAFT_700953 [Tothia fuscella]|uniref:Uncharacterized protein n=1 Tax=Tothia fuscella TaxID=1048955 RepID=A0A9P4NJ35_9PEZI|nr:hypothetical protein EJ08DRAFT_700953 [Tothia fuscella]